MDLACDSLKPILLKIIMCKIKGDAGTLVAMHKIDSWEKLSKFLKNNNGYNKSFQICQSELINARQKVNEKPFDFGIRIFEILSQMIEVLPSNLNENDRMANIKLLNTQALNDRYL